LPVPRCDHKTEHTVVKCEVSVYITLLMIAPVLNFPDMLCSKRLSCDDVVQIKKYWDYVALKVMHVERWNCMRVSFFRCPLCTNHYKN